MPETMEIPVVVEDDKLREGLKHMFDLVNTCLVAGAVQGYEEFVEMEDKVVDAFVGGLRTNGYDIVKLDETS